MMKKISNRELEERVNRAVDNFMQGYGCCQSVLAAFCDLYGMDETLALKVAAGFGGGVGRLRMMCGAVSGLVMLVGLDCGQTVGSDREGKSACYKVVQDLLAQSQAENGSLICADLVLPNTIRRVPALPKWRARHASLRSISARNIPKRRYSLSVA